VHDKQLPPSDSDECVHNESARKNFLGLWKEPIFRAKLRRTVQEQLDGCGSSYFSSGISVLILDDKHTPQNVDYSITVRVEADNDHSFDWAVVDVTKKRHKCRKTSCKGVGKRTCVHIRSILTGSEVAVNHIQPSSASEEVEQVCTYYHEHPKM
jgi:hypothetical protein